MELSLWPSGRCTLLWVAFSLAAASRGRGWLGGMGWDGMGAGGLEMRQPATADGDGGGGGGPVGAGTPAAPSIPYPPWSREGRSFFRETPAGGDERRVASQTNTGGEGGRARGRQGPGIRVDCT